MSDAAQQIEPEVALLPALPMERSAARAVVGLRLAIADLDAQRADLYEQGDTDSLLVGLAALKTLIRDLRTLEQTTEDNAAELMGTQQRRTITIPLVGTFERKRKTSRKAWQHAELARAVVEQAMAEDRVQHPLDVLDVLMESAGIGYWRVEPLRAHGFTVDEWCEESVEGYGVKITADTK